MAETSSLLQLGIVHTPFSGPTPTHGPFKPWRLILSLFLCSAQHTWGGESWLLAEPEVCPETEREGIRL